MKKITIIAFIILANLSLGACTKTDSPSESNTTIIQDEQLPTRPADINGSVKSIEGNEIIVAKELKEALSEEEQEAQKEARQALSQEERQASRQTQAEEVETENITIIIPVGVPLHKASGTGDGSFVSAELSEIKSDTYVSLWLENEQVIAVKIKGSNL